MSSSAKDYFVSRVNTLALERTREIERRHNSCVSADAGVKALASLFRPERLPASTGDLDRLAKSLVDWSLPLDRDAPPIQRPYRDEDIEGDWNQ
ncbi:MAG: hypothetical protein KIT79_10935 [Deltaproteobacteria bacterium]|nr:hypothetical protein [Deltaproteobacteria bacterium]